MKVSITIADDIKAPIEYSLQVVQLAIHHWRHTETWSNGASMQHDRQELRTQTYKTDAGWAVKVYNL
jgi:hypothetical protein